jgi:hypothetical protein
MACRLLICLPPFDEIQRNLEVTIMKPDALKLRTAMASIALVMAGFSLFAATATQLKFSATPTNAVVGAPIANLAVQLANAGTNVAQGGVVVGLTLNKSGLSGATNATTDATGLATFTNVVIKFAGSGNVLTASSSGLRSTNSTSFIVSKGGTATALASSTNLMVYGQSVTFTATVSVVSPAAGTPTGTVTFKDSGVTLGSAAVSAGVATFTTNRLSATTTNRTITAIYGGDTNFLTSTSSNFLQAAAKLALTVSGITVSNKIYDGTTTATLNCSNAVLAGILSGDNVKLNAASATGVFADKSAGTNKTVAVSGLTLTGTNAGNYSVTQPTVNGAVLPRLLAVAAKGVNKVYDGTTSASVTLSDNRLSGDVFSYNYFAAAFVSKDVNTNILINVSGLSISGTNAGNYALSNLAATASANITKATLTVSNLLVNSKAYDGTTIAALNFSNAALVTVFGGDAVTLITTNAKGYFASKYVGTNIAVTVSGLTLGGSSVSNYLLMQPASKGNITPRPLVIIAKGVNKVYNGTTNATVTLSDNRISGDALTNSYAAAAFVSKNVGTNILINVSGLAIAGTNAGNYTLSNLTATTTANITKATLTVSNVVANSKVYDGTTTATLNFSNAALATILGGDSVTLITTNAKAYFVSKYVGTNIAVTVSGLMLGGANSNNYSLTQPAATANITPRPLVIAAKGANKVYDGTTNATVTLSDNHVAGDVLADSFSVAAFVSKDVGTNILIEVTGLAFTGTNASNYYLSNLTATAAANITRAALTVSNVLANGKVYDGTTTATLNFSNAALVTVFAGDSVMLVTTNAKANFASKYVGTNKTVTVSGLTLSGANTNDYTLTQPAASASITPRSLVITAKGVNRVYDGTTNATVTLTDNHISGDLLTNSYVSAAFVGKDAGTNILIQVCGLATTGPAFTNYFLAATNTTASANITKAVLLVAAANGSRPYGTTNPILIASYSGFVAGESLTNSDVTGAPALATSAKTNSPVGNYSIVISLGTLASVDYKFTFTNGILTVTKADTAAFLTTSLNPALRSQNVTFAAAVNPLPAVALPVSGVIKFRCNGTTALGSAISITNGAADVTVLAAALGQSNTVITAEFSDPAGNFSSSTNSLTQSVVAIVTPPAPGKLSLAPSFANGNVTGELSGTANSTYVIQASADLVNWISISTNVADTNGIVWLVDSNAVTYPNRFYRAFSQ